MPGEIQHTWGDFTRGDEHQCDYSLRNTFSEIIIPQLKLTFEFVKWVSLFFIDMVSVKTL